jgi:hypothetical protein
MFACSPNNSGLAGQTRWKEKNFESDDYKKFGDGLSLVRLIPEGQRILKEVGGIYITWEKRALPVLNHRSRAYGQTHERESSIILADYAGIYIDLNAIRNIEHRSEKIKREIVGWVIYHELRHVESGVIVGGQEGEKMDRILDQYLYPSSDNREKDFQLQSGFAFGETEFGTVTFHPDQ